jgi:hypothetical protein
VATDAGDELQRIERLLDERVGRDEGVEDLSVFERVRDVVAAFEAWSDLAIRRLHELHRVQGAECDFCGKWLDGRRE